MTVHSVFLFSSWKIYRLDFYVVISQQLQRKITLISVSDSGFCGGNIKSAVFLDRTPCSLADSDGPAASVFHPNDGDGDSFSDYQLKRRKYSKGRSGFDEFQFLFVKIY